MVESLPTFHGTPTVAAFAHTASQVAPSGVGVAQTHPRDAPFAQAVAHVGADAGHGVLPVGHGVVAQPARVRARVRVRISESVFIGRLLLEAMI
jgi:hypothetical protein